MAVSSEIHAGNHQARQRFGVVQGVPTIPSTLQEELQTNPFLRPDDPAIRKSLGMLSIPESS